jgi:hypothetical protein
MALDTRDDEFVLEEVRQRSRLWLSLKGVQTVAGGHLTRTPFDFKSVSFPGYLS